MDYYYLNDDREIVGPISASGMAALRQTGVIRADTLVALDGGEDWRPASVCLPPPVPPTASPQQSEAAPGRWLAVAGVAAVLVIVICGGVAWALLKKGTFANDAEKAHYSQVEETSAGRAREIEVREPVLGGIEPVPASATAAPLPENMRLEGSPATVAQTGSPSTGAEEHLLGEWYEFGYEQGAEIARAFHDLGAEPVVNRTHLVRMIRSLDADLESIAQPNMRICLEGYEDGVIGNAVRYKPKASQTATLLPKELRIYTKLPEPEERKGRFKLEKALACTVLIRSVARDSGEGHGSGFFVAPGLVATNRHVIEGAETFTVTTKDNRSFDAAVVEVSNGIDFALLRIKLFDHPVFELGRSESVRVGDEVIAIGFPILDTMSATTTFGRISSVDRNFSEFGAGACFQIDLSISPGNSGGPLVDPDGRVIGVNTFGLYKKVADRMNFAIKVESFAPLIRKHMTR